MLRILFIGGMLVGVVEGNFVQIQPVPMERIDELMREKPKPVLVLLSTEWCNYCHMQKRQVRRSQHFLKKANEFYYIEFDAETKESLRFMGNTYSYKAEGVSGGMHELAIALGGSPRISFPTWVFLDENYQVAFRFPGVFPEKQLKEAMELLMEVNKRGSSPNNFEKDFQAVHKAMLSENRKGQLEGQINRIKNISMKNVWQNELSITTKYGFGQNGDVSSILTESQNEPKNPSKMKLGKGLKKENPFLWRGSGL